MFTTHFKVAFGNDFNQFLPGQVLPFEEGVSHFAVLRVPLSQDSVAVQAGATLAVGDDISLSLDYDGNFGKSIESNGIRGGFTWKF